MNEIQNVVRLRVHFLGWLCFCLAGFGMGVGWGMLFSTVQNQKNVAAMLSYGNDRSNI
ncbi:MAG: hypothetical protein LBJ00_10105 [Planctomycetaceae bacterium]|nr:hypothetical protein [Planctomycetaceae bacterium]